MAEGLPVGIWKIRIHEGNGPVIENIFSNIDVEFTPEGLILTHREGRWIDAVRKSRESGGDVIEPARPRKSFTPWHCVIRCWELGEYEVK